MLQAQIQVGQTFPATLFFRSDGTVVVAGHQGASPIIDNSGSVKAVFDQNGFSLQEDGVDTSQDYSYNVAYRVADMPVLTAYLKQLDLEFPQ